jgi:hypothetical protein
MQSLNTVVGLPFSLRCFVCEGPLAEFHTDACDAPLPARNVPLGMCYRFESQCASCHTRHVWMYRGKHGVVREFTDYRLYLNEDAERGAVVILREVWQRVVAFVRRVSSRP